MESMWQQSIQDQSAQDFFDQADPDGTYLKSVERFLLEPDAVAKKIVKIIGKNKRELNLPVLLNLAHKFYTFFPKLADKLAGESLIINRWSSF